MSVNIFASQTGALQLQKTTECKEESTKYCLFANSLEISASIILKDCTKVDSNNGLWLIKDNMIKPFLKDDLCITSLENSTVKLQKCEDKITQKWRTPYGNSSNYIKPLEIREAMIEDFGEIYMTKDSLKADKFKFINYFVPDLGKKYKLQNVKTKRFLDRYGYLKAASSDAFKFKIENSKLIFNDKSAVILKPVDEQTAKFFFPQNSKCMADDLKYEKAISSECGFDVSVWRFIPQE
jgi:hypothetical protein